MRVSSGSTELMSRRLDHFIIDGPRDCLGKIEISVGFM